METTVAIIHREETYQVYPNNFPLLLVPVGGPRGHGGHGGHTGRAVSECLWKDVIRWFILIFEMVIQRFSS